MDETINISGAKPSTKFQVIRDTARQAAHLPLDLAAVNENIPAPLRRTAEYLASPITKLGEGAESTERRFPHSCLYSAADAAARNIANLGAETKNEKPTRREKSQKALDFVRRFKKPQEPTRQYSTYPDGSFRFWHDSNDRNHLLDAVRGITPQGFFDAVLKDQRSPAKADTILKLIDHLETASQQVRKNKKLSQATEALKLLVESLENEAEGFSKRIVPGTGLGPYSDSRIISYYEIFEFRPFSEQKITKDRVDRILRDSAPRVFEQTVNAIFDAIGKLDDTDPELPRSLMEARNDLEDILGNIHTKIYAYKLKHQTDKDVA